MEPEASIVVPVHNEAPLLRANTEEIIRYLGGCLKSYEILLCENGSLDETLDIARSLAEENESVDYITLPEPCLAEALKRGFSRARSDKVVYYPIDLSVELSFIPESVRLLEEFDVVVGSKRLWAGSDLRPLARRLPSRAYHWLVRRLYGTRLTDTTCVKAYRRGRVLSIVDRVPVESSVFETELLVEAQREGFRIKEVPVRAREHRVSRQRLYIKMTEKLEDLLSARLDLIALSVGILMFVCGMIVASYLVVYKVALSSGAGFVNPYAFLLSMLLIISGFQITTFGLLANLILQMRREIERVREER